MTILPFEIPFSVTFTYFTGYIIHVFVSKFLTSFKHLLLLTHTASRFIFSVWIIETICHFMYRNVTVLRHIDFDVVSRMLFNLPMSPLFASIPLPCFTFFFYYASLSVSPSVSLSYVRFSVPDCIHAMLFWWIYCRRKYCNYFIYYYIW